MNRNCKVEPFGKLIYVSYQIRKDGPYVYHNFLMLYEGISVPQLWFSILILVYFKRARWSWLFLDKIGIP